MDQLAEKMCKYAIKIHVLPNTRNLGVSQKPDLVRETPICGNTVRDDVQFVI